MMQTREAKNARARERRRVRRDNAAFLASLPDYGAFIVGDGGGCIDVDPDALAEWVREVLASQPKP